MTGKKAEQDVLEKGFNDDELADIMNEIESLEKEFEPEHTEEVEATAADPVEEVYEEKTEEVKEVFEEMVQKPVEEVVRPKPAPVPAPTPVHHIHHAPAPAPKPEPAWAPSGAQTSMSFKVEGEMKLSMSFWVSGKEFKVWVDEKEGFMIELDGGAQFKVPIEKHHKKAA